MTSEQALQLLPHRTPDSAQTLVFVGRRGMGKTWLIGRYLMAREPRVLVLDPFEDFRAIRRRLTVERALEDLAEGKPCRRRIVPPFGGDTKAWARSFFAACRAELRDCLLVLDEISLYSETKAPDDLEALLLQGRRIGVRTLLASQRLVTVPVEARSACTELVLFQQTGPLDLDQVERWTATKDAAEAAPKLGPWECLVVTL